MAACCYKQNNNVIWLKRVVRAFFGTRKACIFVWNKAWAPIKTAPSVQLSILPLSLCTHRFLFAHLRSASGISSGSCPLSQLLHLTPFQGAQRKFQRPLWWYLPDCRDAAVGLNCCCSCTSGMRETLTVFTRRRTKHADDLSLHRRVWLWKSYHSFFLRNFYSSKRDNGNTSSNTSTTTLTNTISCYFNGMERAHWERLENNFKGDWTRALSVTMGCFSIRARGRENSVSGA